jgi:hypothetical protein
MGFSAYSKQRELRFKMITVSSKYLIKRFTYDLRQMNVSYLIKTLLCILQKDECIELIIIKKGGCDEKADV